MTLLTMLLFAQIPVPLITFPAPPPLVVIQPGIQVVEDHDEEVFFTDGYYWHRREGNWFRTKEHNGKWVVVEEKAVPVKLVAFKPGAYRHYKHEMREEKRERKEERKEEKREKHGKHGKD